jgi:aldose 1-epimerase
VTVSRFARIGETDILEVRLCTQAGAVAKIITWGAVVRDLVVPGPKGPQRVVLGLETIEDYIERSPYFGAIVGRYGNRIAGARFALDGEEHRLDPNEGRHQLHGGPTGFGQRLWSVLDRHRSGVTLGLVSKDGDMGYPGDLFATCTYTLLEPATLRVELQATCNRPTPVNLTTHSYYNLDGTKDVCSHHLLIAGDFITPTDAELIPTGEVRAVAGTSYDFTELRPIGASQLLQCRTTYDVNYVLRHPRGALGHAATLLSRTSGVGLELWTTEPGVQFYDGHLLDGTLSGLDGAVYGPRAGLCLEPQRFPDGPNRAHFPPCILRPGEVSRQVSEIRFFGTE